MGNAVHKGLRNEGCILLFPFSVALLFLGNVKVGNSNGRNKNLQMMFLQTKYAHVTLEIFTLQITE